MGDSRTRRQGGLSAGLSLVLVVTLAVIGALAGVVAAESRGGAYTAEASVLLTPLDGNPFSPGGRGDDLVNLQTEAELVRSDEMGERVIDLLDLEASTSDVISGLDVENPPNTQVLVLRYTATDRDRAIERAQGFADAFLEFREARATTLIENRIALAQDQISDQQAEVRSLTERFTNARAPEVRALVNEQIDVATTQLNQLETQLATYESAATAPGQVITPAGSASADPLRSPVLLGVVGAVLGALVGALLVWVVRRRSADRL